MLLHSQPGDLLGRFNTRNCSEALSNSDAARRRRPPERFHWSGERLLVAEVPKGKCGELHVGKHSGTGTSGARPRAELVVRGPFFAGTNAGFDLLASTAAHSPPRNQAVQQG